MGKTMAEVLIEEGKIEGKIEGKLEGLHKAVSLGLELKFGTDGIVLNEKTLNIKSTKKLEMLIEAIKIAKSIEEIEKLV